MYTVHDKILKEDIKLGNSIGGTLKDINQRFREPILPNIFVQTADKTPALLP